LRRILPPPISPSDQLPTLHRSIESSSLPSGQPSTCADRQPSGSAFGPDLRLSPNIASSSFPFEPGLRLAPEPHPPVLPSNPTSDSSSEPASLTSPSRQSPIRIGHRPSGSALRLTSGFHRRRIFELSLRTQLPACAETCILRFCQRPTLELVRSLNPPAVPSISNRLASAFNHSAVPATNFPTSFER